MSNIIEVDFNAKKRMGSYERELGCDGASADELFEDAYITAFKNYWKNEFKDYYHGEVNVDGKRVALIELPPNYLPANVLGMTDCFSAIWLRNDLTERFGYGMRDRVLEHEKEHVRDPTASELEVRRRTNTVSLTPYSKAA